MLAELAADCPYCGARLTLLVDESVGPHSYTEDCHVCCQPIEVNVSADMDGDTSITVEQENA